MNVGTFYIQMTELLQCSSIINVQNKGYKYNQTCNWRLKNKSRPIEDYFPPPIVVGVLVITCILTSIKCNVVLKIISDSMMVCNFF